MERLATVGLELVDVSGPQWVKRMAVGPQSFNNEYKYIIL